MAGAAGPHRDRLRRDGPVAEPAGAQHVLDATTGVLGIFGTSSMERRPTERVIAAQARDFKNLTV